jgi:DNA replication protein DnaC
MQTTQTSQKLSQLKLYGMTQAFEEQLASAHAQSLGFEERFGMVVDAETTYRDNAKLKRLLRQAKLHVPASVDQVIQSPERNLKSSTVENLRTCTWIAKGQNLVMTGATGTGKTWLACAFGHQACRKGYSVLFQRLSMMLEDLKIARADGSFKRKIAALARYDLLILDDLGSSDTFLPEYREYLLEVVDARIGNHSTVMTSQYPVSRWRDYLSGGNPTVPDAILDRLLSGAIVVELKGDSLRARRAE